MARLSEIVERVKSQDTITGAQAEEQISLLGAIRDQLKLSNIQLFNINKTLIDSMAAERRYNDNMLLAFREAEMEKKKEELKGTSANPNEPQSSGFGLGDLIIPALLAWQAGLDDVIQAITVVPKLLKEIAVVITGKLLGAFRIMKNVVVFALIQPIEAVINFIKNSKTFGLIMEAMTSLKMMFSNFILTPLNNMIDSLKNSKMFTGGTEFISSLKTTIQDYFKRSVSFILRPFEIVADSIKNSKIVTSISGAFSAFSTFFETRILTPINNVAERIKNSKLFKALSFDFGTLVDAFNNNILKPISNLTGRVNGSKVLTSISDAVTGLLTYMGKFSGVMHIVKGVSRLLSKLPILNVIFGVYDFIQGFLKGYNEDGLLAGIKEGIFEVVRGLVTKPLDLIKDVVSWAATKLGFSGFSEVLDSFSFTRLFDDYIVPAINGIIDWLGTLFTDPVTAIKSLMSGSLTLLENVGQWVVDTLLTPMANWFSETFTTENILSAFSSMWTAFLGGMEDLGSWIWNFTGKPVTDWFASLIPEGGILNYLSTKLSEMLGGAKDFGEWLYLNLLKPFVEWSNSLIPSWFRSDETPAEINAMTRQGSGGARRGEVIIPPREPQRDDRAPVTIGQVIGSVNNTTAPAAQASAPANVGLSSRTSVPDYLTYDMLGNPLN